MLLPVLASAALILSAPYMALLRTWLGDVFQASFFTFMAVAIGTAVAVVAVVALVRIRTHRIARFATIGLALAIATGYSRAMATGGPDVDIVERVHFVEYGVIAFLFYRAWRPAADVSVIVLPILAGIVVGTLEEWFQWFIPNRVGELRDVALNLVAVVCGLMISIAITPPVRVALSLSPESRRRVAIASACVIASVAFFVDQIHLGHDIAAEDFSFRSHWSAPQLGALSADRAARWKTDPPITWRRLSREDQYMDEGLWHAPAATSVGTRTIMRGRGRRIGFWRSTSRPCSIPPRTCRPAGTGGPRRSATRPSAPPRALHERRAALSDRANAAMVIVARCRARDRRRRNPVSLRLADGEGHLLKALLT